MTYAAASRQCSKKFRVRAVLPLGNYLEASYRKRRLRALDPGARPRVRVQLLTGFP